MLGELIFCGCPGVAELFVVVGCPFLPLVISFCFNSAVLVVRFANFVVAPHFVFLLAHMSSCVAGADTAVAVSLVDALLCRPGASQDGEKPGQNHLQKHPGARLFVLCLLCELVCLQTMLVLFRVELHGVCCPSTLRVFVAGLYARRLSRTALDFG